MYRVFHISLFLNSIMARNSKLFILTVSLILKTLFFFPSHAPYISNIFNSHISIKPTREKSRPQRSNWLCHWKDTTLMPHLKLETKFNLILSLLHFHIFNLSHILNHKTSTKSICKNIVIIFEAFSATFFLSRKLWKINFQDPKYFVKNNIIFSMSLIFRLSSI